VQYEGDAHKLLFPEFPSPGRVLWRSYHFRLKGRSSAAELFLHYLDVLFGSLGGFMLKNGEVVAVLQ